MASPGESCASAGDATSSRRKTASQGHARVFMGETSDLQATPLRISQEEAACKLSPWGGRSARSPLPLRQRTLPTARAMPMIRVRGMTFEDLTLGLRLKQRVGWNQTAADWARFLSLQPDGCFVAELDGEPVGTVTTCVFGTVAWVGMMLVDPGKRGRGVGRALMARALAFLDSRGVRGVRLDATPLGEPLYRSLGFVPQYPLSRLEGVLDGGEEVPGV